MALRPAALARALITSLAVAALAPAAAGAVTIQHDSTAVTIPGSAHGDTIWPGDDAQLTPTIENTDGDVATSVTGALTSSGQSATVTQGSSGFPDLSFAGPEPSSTPFGIHVASDAECGINLPLSLGVGYSGGSGNAAFSVPTGSVGPRIPFDATDLPRAIPDGDGNAPSSITVGQTGRVKALQIRVGQIDHSYTGDLQIDLVAPDGTHVRLKNADTAPGTDVHDLVFSDTAPTSINQASAPFTGTYRPVEPLSSLVGHTLGGRWQLVVSDTRQQDAGTFESWGMDVSKAVCTDGPLPGLAATPNPATPGQSVTLDASSSLDPGATIVKYEFDLGDGNGFSVDNGTDPTLDHLFPAGGYDVRVRITDDHGGAGGPRTAVSSPVHLSVGQPPDAALTASTTTPATGQSVTFDASGSTVAQGTIVSYEWDFDGDGIFDRTTQTPTTTYSYAKAGPKRPRVRVTSDIGATDSAGVNGAFVVQDRAPSASFTNPSVLVVGTNATFTSTATDPDDNVAHWTWTVTPKNGAGAATIVSGQDTPSLTVSFASPGGSYDVGLVVQDDAGESSTKAVKTLVATRPPTASFTATPSSVTPDTAIAFDGSASSDPEGPIAAWAWDFDNNGTWDATGANPTLSAGFSTLGPHTVRLRVTDADGATAQTTRTVTVKDDPPVAVLSVAPNPVVAGTPVTISAAASHDPDGTVTSYDWDLDGDGEYEVTRPATFVTSFPAAGTLRIGVRVHDDHGATGATSVLLTVTAPPAGGTTDDGVGPGGTYVAPTKPAAGSGTKAPAGGSSTSGTTAKARARFLAKLGGYPLQRLRTVRKGGLRIRCAATRAGRCAVVAKISARDARRLGLKVRGKRAVTIGQAKVALRAGRARALKLKLNRAGRRAFKSRRLRRLTVRLSAVATDAAKHRARASRVVLVRR